MSIKDLDWLRQIIMSLFKAKASFLEIKATQAGGHYCAFLALIYFSFNILSIIYFHLKYYE